MVNDTRMAFDGPVELVKAIFDTAARQERSTALQLVRVCKAARHWVMPILYETVELDNPAALRFESMLTMSTSSETSSLVKNLRATCLPNADMLSTHCRGLRAVTVANYDVPRLHQLFLPSLRHLTVCGFLRYAHLAPSMSAFKTVTHLRFANDVPRLPHEFAEAMPHLTHFACCYSLNKSTQYRELEDSLHTVLDAPELRVALVYVQDNTPENLRAVADVINAIRDPRVVVASKLDVELPEKHGNHDAFWEFADKTVASRSSRDRS